MSGLRTHAQQVRPFSLLAFLLVSLFFADPGCAAKESAWLLEQYSEECGKQKAFITATALKVINQSQHTTTVMSAPSWHIVVCNDRTKTYYETRYDQWHGAMAQRVAMVFGEDIPKAAWRLVGTQQIAGHRTSKYAVIHDDFAGDNFMGQTHVARRLYWLADDLPVDKRIANALSRLLGFPEMDKVPIRYAGVQPGKLIVALNTTTITGLREKEAKIQYPQLAGYTRIKNDAELHSSPQTDDAVKTFFGK